MSLSLCLPTSRQRNRVVLAASVGQVVPDEGASKVCTPEAAKVAGSVSVHSASPGSPLLSAFSVTVILVPTVGMTSKEMVEKLMPIESNV